ncbi:MAG TPA: HIT family protein [Rhodospirillales bacterium]|jgi:histidine triad (HIT) family protein|nr:MAG: HIT family protein [Rhodospirillaceae bacterium]PPR72491.1 MAG: Purine nucleoside phosphoramidase [Alphaproteobacteria bacterium MarineAlpha3_Bin2]HIC28337.1 HIT family protein [Rhodospirillales bacterium]HIM78449.1 HIT family protein [Rhodospirillales bacterium]
MTEAHLDDDCIFCKIIRGEIPCFKVLEDADVLALMDVNPIAPGHVLVIPKHHAKDILETPLDCVGKAFAGAGRAARAVQKTLAPDGINILQANGPGAKQSVFHLHVHVIPRGMDDGLSMNWELAPGDMDQIGRLAEQIASNVE